MLIGDFATRLDKRHRTGTFEIEELDQHFGALDSQLRTQDASKGEIAFWTALSFLINQATQWDALSVTGAAPGALEAALLHGRTLAPGFDVSGPIVAIERLPVQHGVIELHASSRSDTSALADIRAPGICFIAFTAPALFFAHAEKIRENVEIGQSYAILLLMEAADSGDFVDKFRKIFELFQTAFWLDIENCIVTLFTVGVKTYEI